MAGFLGLQAAARESDTNRAFVALVAPALRAWVGLYCTNPDTWPEDDEAMLRAATAALKLIDGDPLKEEFDV